MLWLCFRYNLDGFHCFVKSGFVSLVDYDKHLAGAMGANGENGHATRFAMHLCKIYLIEEQGRANGQVADTDFYQTIEVHSTLEFAFSGIRP